jgi:uncharacterized protein (TIGR00645 family)
MWILLMAERPLHVHPPHTEHNAPPVPVHFHEPLVAVAALPWFDLVNASVLKVKLATAIIGISSIHLLKTFINAANYTDKVLLWQTAIHIAFLLSAMAIAYTDRLMVPAKSSNH